MSWVRWVVASCAGVALVAFGAGQLGLFSGHAPNDLGVRDGRLKAPSKTPNSVSSQAHLWPGLGTEYAHIAPLALRGDAAQTMAKLQAIVVSMPGARVVEARPDYLYVQFTTRWMKFVDDTEFWFDPASGVVQVRSASRVGRKDLGVNRERVESIRARLAHPSP